MTEPAAPQPVQPAAPAQEPPAAPSTPPWGEDFDPARAWHTIQTLREAEKERDQLRKQTITPEQRQQLDEYARLVEASKTEQQRQQEATVAAQTAAATAAGEALRYRIAFENGIAKDDLVMLTASDEETLAMQAQRVAALRAAATPGQAPAPTRPVENLRPGATPSPAENADDAIYARLFGAPKS